MKTKIIMLAAALVMSCGVFAQQGQGGGQGGQRQGQANMTPQQQEEFIKSRVEAMATAVGSMTADEKAKATVILKDASTKQQALRTAGGDQAQMREKMQVIREDQNKKLETLLGADRYKKYQAAQPQRGQGGQRQGGQGGQGGGQRPQ